MNKEHNKRIAVISGGTGYVGSAIARTLAEKGMSIALLCRTSSDSTKIQELMNSLPGEYHRVYECDFFSKESVVKAITSIEKEMGIIGVCIHAAGEKPNRKTVLSINDQDLDGALTKNVVTAHNVMTACAQAMKAHSQGVIVGITTAGVLIPEATRGLGAYILAKYAIQGELVALKEEMKAFGVRVYSVAPGFMEGGMNADVPKAFVEMIRKKNGKITTREDVAETIAYLCSDDATREEALTHLVAREYED